MRIDRKIRLIELFGGIGSQAMALRDIGAAFEHWRLVENDPRSVAAYNAIHGTDFAPSDITALHGEDLGIDRWGKEKYCYLMTYSFPCQDLSSAGMKRGMERGSGTRSSLLWEVERLLTELPDALLPDVLLMENVPQVHNKKNAGAFNEWLGYLAHRGYESAWADLDARDFGVPQSRRRCFCVSALPLAWAGGYEFPRPVPLAVSAADLMEEEPDARFYVDGERSRQMLARLIGRGVLDEEGVCLGD